MNEDQYRLFAASQAQPYALAAMILVAGAGFLLHAYAAFWLAIGALGFSYLDWMLTAFLRTRLAVASAWCAVACMVVAIIVMARVM